MAARRADRRLRAMAAGLLLAAIAPVIASLVVAWSRGWTLAAVETGSMAPAVPPGAVVMIAAVDPADIEPGTILAFEDRSTGRLVVHRVTTVVDNGGNVRYETRGDANRSVDPELVEVRHVRGEVVTRVLGAGWLIRQLTDRRIAAALAVGPTLAWALLAVLDRRRPRCNCRASTAGEGLA